MLCTELLHLDELYEGSDRIHPQFFLGGRPGNTITIEEKHDSSNSQRVEPEPPRHVGLEPSDVEEEIFVG